MKIHVLFVVVSILALCLGCDGTKNCVRFDGGYEGFTGGMEWCFSETDSKENGVPTFADPDGDESYLVEEGWIDSILGLFEDEGPSASASSMPAKTEKPIIRLRKLLNQRE